MPKKPHLHLKSEQIRILSTLSSNELAAVGGGINVGALLGAALGRGSDTGYKMAPERYGSAV
jgi:hypothetical protein